jgi:outer membrane biosynthesis protein TonB
MSRVSCAHGSAPFALRPAILGIFLLALAASGNAQSGATGALTGTVVHSNELLPGTTVTITSPAIPTGPRSTVTDAQGRYRFTQLPPGSYEVAFSLTGFRRLIVEGVAVPAGTDMGLIATMTSGPVEERQVVASDAVSLGAAPTASTATDADTAPERLVTVLPRYPRDAASGTAGTVSVMFTLDAAGRPFNVQPAPEHDLIGLRDVDGVLSAAPKPGENFRTAAVDAVTGWVYAAPVQGEVTLLVQFTFLAQGRVRLVREHVVEPIQASLAPGNRLQVGTAR